LRRSARRIRVSTFSDDTDVIQRCAHFPCAEHRRSFQASAENPEARSFADDETLVSGGTVVFSPLPHNPAIRPRHLVFRHGRRWGGILEAIKSRAENAPTVPRFPENDSIARLARRR